MSDSEAFVFFFCIVLALVGTGIHRTGALHPLYFRSNPAPGIVRLGVLLSMAWIALVLANFADPSVTGIYIVFYLIMGFAVVKMFGQTGVWAFGPRARIDAGERRNVAAAIVIAAFTLATGLIFGGSLWGEADPVGGDEGGWWIPLTFFLLGWFVLVAAFRFYLRRENVRFADRIRRERSIPDARAAATFLLGSAVTLTDAVSGDFWGWRHGLLTFGVIASMLLVHEIFAGRMEGDDDGRSSVDGEREGPDTGRALESVVYILLAGVVWFLNRILDATWGPG